MNKIRVAINGFGRIGREFCRIALEKGINVVAINDPSDVKNAEYLLRYDSVHGKYPQKISSTKNTITVGKKKIQYFKELDPENLPWKKLKVDLVVESSGHFKDKASASKHLKAGAKKVLISAPSKDSDFTLVLGVNHKNLKKSHKIISMASCTTNCLAPLVKVLHKKYKIKSGLMTTVHAYTNDQKIQDSFHKSFRRGRAGSINIIPTTTGASEAVCKVIPELKGKLNGMAIRVPVANNSIVDLVAEVSKPTTAKDLNKTLKQASKKELKGILDYTEEPIVSSDITGNQHSSIVDGLSTQTNKNLIKVLAWYDNEYGYSARLVDTIKLLSKLK